MVIKRGSLKYILIFIIVILTLIITSLNCFGFGCVSYSDCPEIDCLGYIRLCTNNECIKSNCIAPSEDILTQEQTIESFEETIKPFESGINLSIKTKNPNLIKNNIMASLGLQDILILLLKGVGVFIGLIFIVIVFIFIKAKGLIKYVFFLIVPVLILIGLFFLIGGSEKFFKSSSNSKSSWNNLEIDDYFSQEYQKQEIGDNQLKYLSPRLLKGVEFIDEKTDSEIKIIILEIDDIKYLKNINLGELKLGKNKILNQEYIIEQSIGDAKRYLFDEDRFVFIVTANRFEIDQITKGIIKRYPKPPEKSRLFLNDKNPPVIILLQPILDEITNDNRVYFDLIDNESGIELDKLRIKNLVGMTDPNTQCKDMDINEPNRKVRCSYNFKNLNQGIINFEIIVSDFEGNSKTLRSNFIYDNEGFSITKIVPEFNTYTNSNNLFFILTDKVSGIQPESVKINGEDIDTYPGTNCNYSNHQLICSISIFGITEGKNEISLTARDLAGNEDTLEHSFIYDDIPPIVQVNDYSFKIFENGEIKQILMNNKEYQIEKCKMKNEEYNCQSDQKIESIYIEDKAGNFVNW